MDGSGKVVDYNQYNQDKLGRFSTNESAKCFERNMLHYINDDQSND